MKKQLYSLLIVILLLIFIPSVFAAQTSAIGVNILLRTAITDEILAELGTYGTITDTIEELNAVMLRTEAARISEIGALDFVQSINPDGFRQGAPIDPIPVSDYLDGLGTWDLDVINVTQPGFDTRQVSEDGTGVYVAVLDTGLVNIWREYLPEERIATEFAAAFGGGGGENGNVSEQPNKWEHDTNSHGTHVTSTIIGYMVYDNYYVTGVAPMVTIIPVKVLNQNGSGWSSAIAHGIVYVADLKTSGILGDAPVVINMSLGGPELDAVEKAAIDYATERGVIIVASAGNEGEAGMGYPGAYEPVISVAATGHVEEWSATNWWNAVDDADPNDVSLYYIADFSSRELEGQDLDVAAPGTWIVGPYNEQMGQQSYYYLGGTSMASPHVAGIAALMMQKNPTLTQAEVQAIMEAAAIPIPAGCNTVIATGEYFCWGDDATGEGLITADAALSLVP